MPTMLYHRLETGCATGWGWIALRTNSMWRSDA